MKLIDLLMMLAATFLVVGLAMNVGSYNKGRQLTLAAQECWDNSERAVYIRVDGEYRIRCEP